MAVYSELDYVVEHIRTRIQSFYETLKKDAVAERLYSTKSTDEAGCVDSPDIDSFLYSKSLEKDPSALKITSQGGSDTAIGGRGNEDKVATSPKKKFKVVNFATTPYSKTGVGEASTFTFEKERSHKLSSNASSVTTSDSTVISNISSLTKLLKPDAQATTTSTLMDDVVCTGGVLWIMFSLVVNLSA